MFDRYMLEEGTLRNCSENGIVTGFSVDIHYPHHCGIWLSIVEEISLSVDGSDIPADQLRLKLDGKDHDVSSLSQNTEDRWYFGQAGTLLVSYPNGLDSSCPHELHLKIALRVSFLNWFLTGEDTKTMEVNS